MVVILSYLAEAGDSLHLTTILATAENSLGFPFHSSNETEDNLGISSVN
jgi:hypothetical protein